MDSMLVLMLASVEIAFEGFFNRETAYVPIGAVSRPATREQLLMLGSSSGVVHPEIMPVNRTTF